MSADTMADRWYEIRNADQMPSPALVFYPERIDENISRMIAAAGSPARLRPHVKTYKNAEIVRMQIARGITAFKCATIAEAEMTAACGPASVLLAMQPVGPAVERLLALQRAFPGVSFGAIVDAESAIRTLAAAAEQAGTAVRLWLDINVGMDRTGIAPGEDAVRLYRLLTELPGVVPGGLHIYDGHVHEHDLAERTLVCDLHFAPAQALIDRLRGEGLPIPEIVAGGTPTFPVHARRAGVTLSPGTTLLWDAGYAQAFIDLEYLIAAVLLTRVVSKPAPGRVCLDLGTKAVATEMPQPRVTLLGMDPYRIVGHNEEHLIIETAAADQFQTGDVVYAVPTHICPTVARYDVASVVRDGQCVGEWRIQANTRRITI